MLYASTQSHKKTSLQLVDEFESVSLYFVTARLVHFFTHLSIKVVLPVSNFTCVIENIVTSLNHRITQKQSRQKGLHLISIR